ncbi:MAG: hypothetical protein WBA57_09330 [Elainellaceae cyanobacterium]
MSRRAIAHFILSANALHLQRIYLVFGDTCYAQAGDRPLQAKSS